MQSIAIEIPTVNEAVFQRIRHLATLVPAAREKLQRDHAWCKTSRMQDEPAEYDYLQQCHYPVLERYRSIRQFFDQLAFRADAKARYFTFLDEHNYSYCNAPAIRIRKFRRGNSLVMIRQFRANGELPQEQECGIACGAWFIATEQASMAEGLQKLPLSGQSDLILGNTYFFRAWALKPDEFEQIRDLIIQYQGKFILPFSGEADIQLTPRALTDQELGQMHTVKDAWL